LLKLVVGTFRLVSKRLDAACVEIGIVREEMPETLAADMQEEAVVGGLEVSVANSQSGL